MSGESCHPYKSSKFRRFVPQLPTSGFRLSASDFRLPTSGFRLPASGFRLPASDFRLPTSGFRLPASDFRLPTSDFQPYTLRTDILIISIRDNHALPLILLSSSGRSHSTLVIPSFICGSVIISPLYFIRNQLVFFR